MDRQSKLLNKQYLETRLRELPEIRHKEIGFDIQESDRAFSNSIYINLYYKDNEKDWKCHTLRISDHLLEKCPHTQFIIEPNSELSKKIKSQFISTVKNCIRKALMRNFYKKLEKVSEQGKGGQNGEE